MSWISHPVSERISGANVNLLISFRGIYGISGIICSEYMCYCKSPKIGISDILPVNHRISHTEVIKVWKMLLNAYISRFYQNTLLNIDIYQYLLVKLRNKRWIRPLICVSAPTLAILICSRTYVNCNLISCKFRLCELLKSRFSLFSWLYILCFFILSKK